MDNFFGYILSGLTAITDSIFSALPAYQPVGLAAMLNDWLNSAPVLIFVYLNQFLGLGLVITLLSAILVLEGIRATLAAWMWVKNAIPFA